MSAAEGSNVSAESLAARDICTDAYCPAVREYRARTSSTSFSNPLRNSLRGSVHSNHEPVVKGLAELNEILNTLTVLCKSPVCYNEYMGYSISTAKTNDPNDNCKKPMCPFTSKYFHKAEKGMKDFTIACKGDECPYKDKPLNATGSTCGGSKCLPPTPTPSESYSTCAGPTCPYTQKPALPPPPPSISSQADTCLGPTCPYNNKSLPTSKIPPPLPGYGGGDDTCGGPTCPYELQKSAPKPDNVMGLCGRTSCPFAFVKPSPKSNYRSSYNTQEAITCPYASDMGQNPCGCGACCSYNGQSSRVPVYSSCQDYGVLKEASRPYSGSLCPYAMAQSPRPTRFDQDRDLYSCLYGAELLAAMDPMHKNKFAKESKDVDVSSSLQIDDDKDCECTDPEVEPCGGPECKLTKMTRDCNRDLCPILKVLSFCTNCGGVVVSPTSISSNTEQIAASSAIESTQASGGNGVNQVSNQLAVLSDLTQKLQKNGPKVPRKSSVVADSSIPGEQWPTKRKRRSKRQQEALYQYPGVQLGHRDCNYVGKHVPRNMGWLWTAKPQGNLKLWRGYKPGAVPRSVHRMMVKHRRDLGIVDPMDYATRKKRSKSNTKLKEEPKHAITFKKMNGVYTVTVNPLKDPKTTQPSESPFVDCTPIQFKIEKEPAPVVRKQKTWHGCPCDCVTSTASEESHEQEASLLSQSDIEFHFSPPAAIPDSKQKKRKNTQDVETQYNTTDVAGSAPSDKKKAGAAGKKGKGKKKGKK